MYAASGARMQIATAYKNIQRLSHIVSVFARHGFQELAVQAGLGGLVSGHRADPAGGHPSPPSTEQRLRMAFEELGTTFVKLGQTLATRPDLVPESYIAEFRRLQDDVPPLPFEQVRQRIEDELELPVTDLFASIEPEPLGAASIAQVHSGRLRDGREVVVKVQRPGIARAIETDVALLYSLASLLERYVPDLAVLNPTGMVDAFFAIIKEELDFIHEAQNTQQFGENFRNDPSIRIPAVIWEFTTRRVLVLERIEGVKISEVGRLRELGYETPGLARIGARAFMRQVFEHGLFHGDLHAGNIFVTGPGTIGLVDFGIVGRLPGDLMESLASLFVSLVGRDFQGAARGYLHLAGTRTADGDPIDVERFARDLEGVIEPILRRRLSEINIGQLMLEMATIAIRHRVRVPSDLLLLCKALVTMESIGRSLDPDFDVLAESRSFAEILLLKRYSPENLMRDLVRLARDMTELGRTLPGQLNQIMRRFERENLQHDVYLKDRRFLAGLADRLGNRVAYALVISGALIGSSLVYHGGHRTLGTTGFALAGLFGLLLAGSIVRPGRQ